MIRLRLMYPTDTLTYGYVMVQTTEHHQVRAVLEFYGQLPRTELNQQWAYGWQPVPIEAAKQTL